MDSQSSRLLTLTADYQVASSAGVGDIAIDLQTCLQGGVAVLSRLRDEGSFITGEELGVLALLSMAETLGCHLVERLNPLPANENTEADGMRAFGEMFIRIADLPSLKLPGDDGCSDLHGNLRLFREALEQATADGLDSPKATGFLKAAAWVIGVNTEGAGVSRDDYAEAAAGVPWPDGEG
jgi:hypothetical protein